MAWRQPPGAHRAPAGRGPDHPVPPDQALFDTNDRALGPCLGPTLVALRHAIIDAIILAADLPDDAVVDVRLTAGEDLGDDVARAIEPGNRRADLHAAQVARPAMNRSAPPGGGTRSDMLGAGPAVAVRLLTAESRGVSRTRPCARTHS